MKEKIILLPLAGSICLFAALVEAWLLTMVRYLKLDSVKKLFPGYRDLVKSHIDYLMMAALVFSTYFVLVELTIQLPTIVCWLIFIGAIYNPFGFFLQAVNPELGNTKGFIHKTGVVVGFLPLSIGLGYAAIAIIVKTLSLLNT